MSFTHTTCLLLAGVALGVGVVVACGDDNPSITDASADDAGSGQCDCPAAEPPLEGRFIQVENLTALGNAAFQGSTAVCPGGTPLLGGGCQVNDFDDNFLHLYQSGNNNDPDGNTYVCSWTNPNGATIDEVRAWATCYVPAGHPLLTPDAGQ